VSSGSPGGRYAVDVDLSNENNSHVLMVRMVGGGKRVLDVGCWTGDLSAEFARFNPRVVGIEIDRDAAEQAKKVLDDVVVADVSELDFEGTFGAGAFDVIVFGDVLEHVTDPVLVLRAAQAALSESGFVVASIPNVAHGSLRLRLLRGDFSYTEVGLLDRTHLRFFTLESVHELFRDAGMAVVELRRTTVDPLLAPEHPIDPATVDPDLLATLRADIEAQTYQFVVKAVRDDRSRSVAALHDRAERLEREVATLRGARSSEVLPASADQALRVGVSLGSSARPDRHHVRDILERELVARFHEPVDLRLLDADVAIGPPGWGPHVVLWLDDDRTAPAHPHVRTVRVTDAGLDTASALGLLASRFEGQEDCFSHLELLRATGRFPDAERVAVLVLDDEPASSVEHLATVLSTDDTYDGVLVMTPEPDGLGVARLEALWPGQCVVTSRPLHVDTLLALFGGSAAVVSNLPFDRAVASSLGIRAAGTDDPDAVLAELDGSLAEVDAAARTGLVLALDRALDKALDRVASVPVDQVASEVARLRESVTALQGRLAQERVRIAAHVAELEVRLAAAASTQAAAAASAAQREAIIQLQEDYGLAVERAATSAAPPRSVVRGARRRIGRLLRGS
jgi:2-polyprenyl-3-methyl-5-hydroxy-6-metoxy-1,4-benzoquinol methylase